MLIPFDPAHIPTATSLWNAACGADLAIGERAMRYNTLPTTGARQAGRVALADGLPAGFVLASALPASPAVSPSQPDFAPVEAVIAAGLNRVFPAAQIEIRQAGRVLLSRAYGWLDPETRQRPTRPDTLFDLASVSKLFVVTAFMTLVEEGKVGLDQPVCTVLPDFSGLRPIQPYEDPLKPGAFVTVNGEAAATARNVDAGAVTFRHLLAHNSGLPAWRPLYKALAAARRMALTTYFSYPTGARVVYSDIGLILLGMAVEKLTGLRLDEAVRERVTEPLKVSGIRYLPVEGVRLAASYPIPNLNIAPTETSAWRGRRIVGEVHDENAYGLGGIAGHAGLFANATDLAIFGQSFLDAPQRNESANQRISESANQRISESANQRISESASAIPHPQSLIPNPAARDASSTQSPIPSTQALLRSATIAAMIRLQAEDVMTRRGLGFALWSPDPEASSNPLSERAFGHTGFTGTSLWMDPARDLVVACLTNRVYYGRDAAGILEFRVALHRAIVEVI